MDAMRIGIFAKTFGKHDASAALQAVRAAGYTCTRFDLPSPDLDAMPASMDADVIAAIAEASRAAGVTIEALSGAYNMIHPDPAVRAHGLSRLAVVITTAVALGIPMVTLCTGSRDAEDQ